MILLQIFSYIAQLFHRILGQKAVAITDYARDYIRMKNETVQSVFQAEIIGRGI